MGGPGGPVAPAVVPDGPRAVFYARLHADAGQPSMRELQRLTRTERRPSGINRTTVHDAFTAPWGASMICPNWTN
jgi:hypothetical protein